MEFMTSAPCASMKVKHVDEEAGKLELVLDESVRVRGGAQAAVGGMFATIGARLLRLPMPLPFKIVPLAFVGVGAGIGAAGAVTALTDYAILAERDKGVTMRWKWGPFGSKELTIPSSDIEAYEIVSHPVIEDRIEIPSFRLMLVTRAGDAHPLEQFATETQAKLRKKLLKRILRAND
jgi:hypothetical protein